jgi:methylmalonyl-CoA mutase N-terminal domain/subunit
MNDVKPAVSPVWERDLKAWYGPEDLSGFDYGRDLGDPGQYPFTRGIYPDMYRGKLWTMRQFSGYGTPEETNRRLRFLLEQGQTGLSVAFDLPTLMGLDSDDARSEGEVGKCGVAVDSLEDMELLFEGIRLDEVTVSMTINAPAAAVLAMYVVAAEEQGCQVSRLSGTCQNDILKEYIAQKEWIYPPEPAMRLVVDTVEFCCRELPRYHPVSISGYHIREAGSTAVQELAFTLRDGIEYVEWCLRRGLQVDEFAPRLSFFFNSHNHFFEEIAKFRAARRLWARIMRERFGALDPRSWRCRFHVQTAGCSLTAQQPYNNVIRTAFQALAAVLGGANSLHTNSLDEALALPSESAARLALRTQQILAHETGVAEIADPLGGSYCVETLTNQVESEAETYIRRIDEMGGMLPAIARGYPQREIQDSAYREQRAVEEGKRIVVGVNAFVEGPEPPVPVLEISDEARRHQVQRLASLRRRRHWGSVRGALEALRAAAASDRNLMPPLIEAVRQYATLGEICETLKEVFGEYREPD